VAVTEDQHPVGDLRQGDEHNRSAQAIAGLWGGDHHGFGARVGAPIPGQRSSERASSRLARTLSVPLRGFTHPAWRAHGHMTDRTGHDGGCQ
jgi:hypothetical protein